MAENLVVRNNPLLLVDHIYNNNRSIDTELQLYMTYCAVPSGV
jgi:hypothetical protein